MTRVDDRHVDIHAVAAALRQDVRDLAVYATVLATTLDQTLPGMVAVERERSLADRMLGRPGQVRRISVRLGDRVLSLSVGHAPTAEIRHEVAGVILSRQSVPLDTWVETLAGELVAKARADARAAELLRRLVAKG